MPRFVILEHDWPVLHWDFLLETGAVLRAWRLLAEPGVGVEIPAEVNFDHRLLYLDFEGPLSGGRGHVRRWDAGHVEWVEDGPQRKVIDLVGSRIAGRVVITNGLWRIAAP
jgi:hypothetical protein